MLRSALLVAFAFVLSGCASTPTPQAAAPPTGVALAFADFFALPVGPRGLEPTPKLIGLSGSRVTVRGYIVAEQEPYAGFFMLAALPVALAERADGPADDLPPATLYVHLPADQRDEIVRYVRGIVEVTGVLELGAVEEASGRISYVRLALDDMSSARSLEADLAAEPTVQTQ